MSTTGVVAVLAYYEYRGRDSQSVYRTRYFCGACERDIGGVYGGACYGHPGTIEEIEAKNDTPHGVGDWRLRDEPLHYYAFCPWCGVAFEDEWWKDRTIQNERVIDHFQDPGTHKGDTHEFRGASPDCMAGHVLSTTDPTFICWCNPTVEPDILGCRIIHKDVPRPTQKGLR